MCTETSLGVSFETFLRDHEDVLMSRRHYVSLRLRHDIANWRSEDVPLRRFGDVPLRRHWAFHLRRTCDVAGTYRKTSLWPRHDVLFPGAFAPSICVSICISFYWIDGLYSFIIIWIWSTFVNFFSKILASLAFKSLLCF